MHIKGVGSLENPLTNFFFISHLSGAQIFFSTFSVMEYVHVAWVQVLFSPLYEEFIYLKIWMPNFCPLIIKKKLPQLQNV